MLLLEDALITALVIRKRRNVGRADHGSERTARGLEPGPWRLRAGTAQAARAATLGELAAGLAHELNQPLGAILTNAQAARRLLGTTPPPVALLREILDDIAADDVRASDVIRRMRALLKKDQMDSQPLDLNELTRDVLRLVASDAILRRVRIYPRLEPDLPGVWGDRVQLQQVILNLLVNGFEAMAENPPAVRRLDIATTQPVEGWVEITVHDYGPGILPEIMDRIFEPFFSTKREGLGMGLAISRSIIEAHHGRLQASNHPDRGAAVVLRLPTREANGQHLGDTPESHKYDLQHAGRFPP